MVSNTLFSISTLERDLESAMQRSLYDFGKEHSSPEMWAMGSLQRNLESTLQSSGKPSNCCGSNGSNPGKGFGVTFGLQIQLNYSIRLRGTVNVGYGNRWGDFGATSSLHFAAYTGGLGTGVNKKDLVVDITAAINLTAGSGKGTPLQSYSLNYNSPIPTLNNFENSFSYGQLLTWNSALNENQFSLDRIQREGMIGFRIGNVNVSSNNDTRRAYFGGGTDKGWTGGISIATPLFEVGFQDFSGDYKESGKNEQKKDDLERTIKLIKKDSSINKLTREKKIKDLEKELKNLTFPTYHSQSKYQKSLNKASTYFRINNSNGSNATVDLIGDAWLQNAIHRAIKDFRFQYDYKKIEVWGGKQW